MEGVIIGFAITIGLIVVGVPIAMAFGALTYFLVLWFDADPSYLIPTTFIKIRSVVLLAVPLFILFGHLLDASGLAKRLIDFINSIIGHIKGGLGTVTVVTTAMFSAISGTDSAAIACIGTVMIPRLEDHGYQRSCHRAGGLLRHIGAAGTTKCAHDLLRHHPLAADPRPRCPSPPDPPPPWPVPWVSTSWSPCPCSSG